MLLTFCGSNACINHLQLTRLMEFISNSDGHDSIGQLWIEDMAPWPIILPVYPYMLHWWFPSACMYPSITAKRSLLNCYSENSLTAFLLPVGTGWRMMHTCWYSGLERVHICQRVVNQRVWWELPAEFFRLRLRMPVAVSSTQKKKDWAYGIWNRCQSWEMYRRVTMAAIRPNSNQSIFQVQEQQVVQRCCHPIPRQGHLQGPNLWTKFA